MNIIHDLYAAVTKRGMSLSNVLHEQQKYHEHRRWSVYQLFDRIKLKNPSARDRAALWHAARAEITTQPAGIRLAVDGVKLAEGIHGSNPVGATILHAAAAWSARYWLEEEAHHEVAYGGLMEMLGLEPLNEGEVVEHRGFFPSDNYIRVCMLQACVEIEASVTYGEMAKTSDDPLVREVFMHIMRDEVQHRTYFVSFAKALVDAGVYPIKDVLSMAHTWIRPNGGETHGSKRKTQTQRDGFVNWWENIKTEAQDPLALGDDQIRTQDLQDRKLRSILSAVNEITGMTLTNFQDLRKAYFACVSKTTPPRYRYSEHLGTAVEGVA